METVQIEINKEYAFILNKALDFYQRIGIGQFEELCNHPTVNKILFEKYEEADGSVTFGKVNELKKEMKQFIYKAKKLLLPELQYESTSLGINNSRVDNSCRVCFDIQQVIRHELWKQNPNRNNIAVDSSVNLTARKSGIINCKIENK